MGKYQKPKYSDTVTPSNSGHSFISEHKGRNTLLSRQVSLRDVRAVWFSRT
jgi:hypothetical protein